MAILAQGSVFWNDLTEQENKILLKYKKNIVRFILEHESDYPFKRGYLVKIPLADVVGKNKGRDRIQKQIDLGWVKIDNKLGGKTGQGYILVVNPILLYFGSRSQREHSMKRYKNIQPYYNLK